MLVCPVCNYSNNSEAEECKNCYWFIQIDINKVGLNVENSIQKKWLAKLIGKLQEKRNIIKSLKADKINSLANNDFINRLHKIETQQKQDNKEIKSLEEKFTELKCLLNSKNTSSDVEIKAIDNFVLLEDTPTSSVIENSFDDFDIRNISSMESSDNNSIFSIGSDRNTSNNFNLTDEPQESSLYNEKSDRESSENLNSQEDTEPEVNSNTNYQSFYRLIRNGELEFTKVSVPQETTEKIRGGTQSELEFVNDRKGKYWIVNWQNIYCLIPKEKTYINQYQYGNFQRVFDCQNYQETHLDFEVLEPATVFKSDGETWNLERKGKIKFI